MKLLALAAVPAMLAMEASASPLDRRSTCTVVWTGSNSEGGGGPGQAPINNNAFNLDVTGGGKHYNSNYKPSGANGVFDYKVPAASWGGLHALEVTAQWNYGGNSWYRCHASKNGNTYTGNVGPDHIDTGTVSVTTDKCTINFPCQ